MPWTGRSPTAPPPSYQLLPSPRRPSRYASVPNCTDDTARSSCAMPRSSGAANMRSANSVMFPPGVARRSVLRTIVQWGTPQGGHMSQTAKRPDDMIMVSVDDHLVEPPDMFEQHIPDKY